MIASIQELLQKEAQAVLNIPVTDAYERAVELIVEQVHRKRETGNFGHGQGRTDSHEHRYHLLLYRYSVRFPAPQRSTAW